MAKISAPHLTKRKRKDGSVRFYWTPSPKLRRAGWKTTPLRHPVTGAWLADELDAARAANAINDRVAAWRAGAPIENVPALADRPKGGTVSDLVDRYKRSRFWSKLSPTTAKGYGPLLDRIERWAGDEPARAITPAMVQDLYETLYPTTPSLANHLITMLRRVYSVGEKLGAIPPNTNPASNPGLVTGPKRDALWPEDVLADFVAFCAAEGEPEIGTACVLARELGQREGDVIRLTWSAYRDGVFQLRQSKTGRLLRVPATAFARAHLDALRARLDEQADGLAEDRAASTQIVISARTGRPFASIHGFSHAIARLRKAAVARGRDGRGIDELEGLWFMDLRRTAVVALAEADCTVPQIGAITGHSYKTIYSILEHYCPRTLTMAAAGIEKLETARRNKAAKAAGDQEE